MTKVTCLLAGIDEAGRGSVCGDLVIAAAYIYENKIEDLTKIFNEQRLIKDSKKFTGKNPQELRRKSYEFLKHQLAHIIVKKISAQEIDRALRQKSMNLNLLEIKNIVKIVLEKPAKQIYVDIVGTPRSFYKGIKKILEIEKLPAEIELKQIDEKKRTFKGQLTLDNQAVEIIALPKADEKIPIVAAASIIAKHMRDSRLRELEKQYNLKTEALGSGYPHKSDQNLSEFLHTHRKEISQKKYPFIRYEWKWKPLQEILKKTHKNKTLNEHF